MADNWHDDRSEYRDASSNEEIPIVTEDGAEDIIDMSEGHWIESGRIWGRPQYAYNFAKKARLPTNYILLVKTYNNEDSTIEWSLLILEGTKRK
jgi:hypothetical protein